MNAVDVDGLRAYLRDMNVRAEVAQSALGIRFEFARWSDDEFSNLRSVLSVTPLAMCVCSYSLRPNGGGAVTYELRQEAS